MSERRYVAAVGRAWGLEVLNAVRISASRQESWACRHFEPDDDREDEGGLLRDLVAEIDPRYVFLLNWSRRIPASLYGPREVVNLHCTALPYGRGGHPIENLLLAGKTETVITAHRVTGEVDAGPVYCVSGSVGLRRRVPVGPGWFETRDDLRKDEILARFVAPCAELVRRVVDEEPEPIPQHGKVIEFSRLSPAAYREFWARRASTEVVS